MTELDVFVNLAKENARHIEIINNELGNIIVRVSVIETKLDLIIRLLWIVIIGIVGYFLNRLCKVIFEIKNNKK